MKKIWFIPAVLWTLMIFSFSTATGDESASLSLLIAEKVKLFWDELFTMHPIDLDVLHVIIRKSAHVGEFLICGVFWSLTLSKKGYRIPLLLGIGLVIALLDEGIQMFVEGRGPSLIDAFAFDFPGFVAGIQAKIWKKQEKGA